jgi:large subunit ribosomal protein L9
MQVILLEKVANLGNLGDVVKVKDGFARNFLIPTRQARRATEVAIKELNGKTVSISQKAGVDGRLFGSVTNADISEGLKKLGFDVPKAGIRMPHGPIKAVGEQTVTVSLHTDVQADVTVAVVGEVD